MKTTTYPNPEIANPKVQSIRDAYFKLPEDRRAHLLVRVSKTQTVFFRYALELIPITGYRADTASAWLKGAMLKRVEQFLDGNHPNINIYEAVCLFFIETNNPHYIKFAGILSDRVNEKRSKKPTKQDGSYAVIKVRETSGNDPYFPLFESWVNEACLFENEPAIPEEIQPDVASLDKEIQLLQEAIAALQQIGQCDVAVGLAALERANSATKVLAERFTALVKESGDTETSAKWSTREEFCQLWEKFSNSAMLKRRSQQSAAAVAAIREPRHGPLR